MSYFTNISFSKCCVNDVECILKRPQSVEWGGGLLGLSALNKQYTQIHFAEFGNMMVTNSVYFTWIVPKAKDIKLHFRHQYYQYEFTF
jgi:hypothetical protein